MSPLRLQPAAAPPQAEPDDAVEGPERKPRGRGGTSTTADDAAPCGSFPAGCGLPRLAVLMDRAIRATGLDLTGLTVLTEAATGAYATTAVIAAMAGAAHVYALAKSSGHGSAEEAEAEVASLASFVGVAPRVTVLQSLEPALPGGIDIVTNSGHLRPLAADLLERLPGRAVVALMFEAWELRPGDIDMECCARRGIPVVGVNERHPAVDVFAFLGPLSVKQLHDCGVAVYGNRIALLCDNAFAPWIHRGLSALGAHAETFTHWDQVGDGAWDAIVVAMSPGSPGSVDARAARHLAAASPPGASIVQFWGDVDRAAVAANRLGIWPPMAPRPGHMGILLSAIGPEPVVRLQAGGLRAAELVFRHREAPPGGVAQIVT